MSGLVLIASDALPACTELADQLGVSDGSVWTVPALPELQGWRWTWKNALSTWQADTVEAGQQVEQLVVCTWEEPSSPRRLDSLDADGWCRVERSMALWSTAVSVASEACADGGALVVVVEQPHALDAGGFGPEVTIAQGLIALTRSFALSAGRRGVRANVVTTELWTAPDRPVGSPPPLATFPGRVDHEVAGAVRMLLSKDAVGVTGGVVHADCGRSW